MDKLSIHDLELWMHIGVPDLERASEQRLLVSIEMELDTKAAATSDVIESWHGS